MIIVEIGSIVVGRVYKRFTIGSFSNLSKITWSFGVGGWVDGTTWEEGGVDTEGGTKVGFDFEMTF